MKRRLRVLDRKCSKLEKIIWFRRQIHVPYDKFLRDYQKTDMERMLLRRKIKLPPPEKKP